MYDFNVNLASTTRTNRNPWSWLVMGRPTAFFYEAANAGQHGCQVETCSQANHQRSGKPGDSGGVGVLAIAVLLFQVGPAPAIGAPGAILAGLAGGYIPWFHTSTAHDLQLLLDRVHPGSWCWPSPTPSA
jgi:hypothetical protein